MSAYTEAQARSKDVPYYAPELTILDAGTREVLEQYSHIPADEVVPHILKIRDLAWAIYPYPCIGQFRFLDLGLGQARQYPDVLRRVKDGERLLDLGCCFGHDIRRLVHDGAPASNLYAADLHAEFQDLGYELFRDRASLSAHFSPADVFAPQSPLDDLNGTVDIIQASAFLHLFGWDQQLVILRKVVKLLRPVKGSMLLGRMMGNETAGSYKAAAGNRELWRHDEESWRKLWGDVSEETGVKFEVEFEWDDWADFTRANRGGWNAEGARPMRFTVYRAG